ncbi:MAG: sensor histidine kinase [Sphaerochaetaceae bacterium]|nr:sensor histidine kinase [Sphaerochaetaceae bacterium]
MNDNKIRKIKYVMLGINIFAIIFILILINTTTTLVCIDNNARVFINSLQKLPYKPTRLLILSILGSILLIFTFYLRQFVFEKNKKNILLTILFDAAISILLMKLVDFNYNGIILWVLANVVYYIESKNKYIAITVGVLLYILTTFSILDVYVNLFSLSEYINYFPKQIRQIILTFYYTLTGFNLICFIVFCVLVIQEQRGRINEINALYKKLSVANEELKQLADIKEKMGETKERNRLAREIHDTLGHSLTAISFGVDACLATLDKDPTSTKEKLQVISEVAKSGIKEVRTSVTTLRADSSEELSLSKSIIEMIEKTIHATGIKINYTIEKNFNLEKYEENAIYRVVQESITNAIRHGHASIIDINLIKDEKNNLFLEIKDNGIGCKKIKPGFGTRHMKERIESIKGSIEYINNKGFTVRAKVPLRDREKNKND